MPRVVANQRERFENDELFRKLSRDLEVKYTGYCDRPIVDRRLGLQSQCNEGYAPIAVIGVGLNLTLNFYGNPLSPRLDERRPTQEFVDFSREPNKVHLKSNFILNGVCVTWKGWLDLRRLDGVGRLEFDIERAQLEDSALTDEHRTAFYDVTSSRLCQQQQHLQRWRHDHSHNVTSSVADVDDTTSGTNLDISSSSSSSTSSSGRDACDVIMQTP